MNIPFADDISDVLVLVSGIVQAEDGKTVLALLFDQHNDHRTMSSRLVYYAFYLVQGEVNFRTLTFAANLGLPLLLFMLFLAIPAGKTRFWVLLPATLLLFQLRAYGITLWSMAAFAYFYVFVYGFASLYCLHQPTRRKFVAALLFATLSTFSLASGQVVWLVGLASLLQQALIVRRISIYYPAGWLVAAWLVLTSWRIGLETPNDMATLLGHLLQTPLHHSNYFLALLGSAVSEESLLAAWLTGAAMLGVLVLFTVRHYRDDDLRLEYVCWFIVLSTAAIVLGRAPLTPLEYALSSRYSFPSVIMLTSIWVLCATRLKLNSYRLLLSASLLAGVYCGSSYPLYSRALQPYMDKRVQNFNHDRFWIFGRPMAESHAIVSEAIALGIYHPPARPYPAPAIAPAPPAETTTGGSNTP